MNTRYCILSQQISYADMVWCASFDTLKEGIVDKVALASKIYYSHNITTFIAAYLLIYCQPDTGDSLAEPVLSEVLDNLRQTQQSFLAILSRASEEVLYHRPGEDDWRLALTAHMEAALWNISVT